MASIIQQRVNLQDNERREIDNPLAWIEDLNALDRGARLFAEKVNPQYPEYDLFVKAARVARDPIDISEESVPGITSLERDNLRNEKSKTFWEQPKSLRITIASLCLGEHYSQHPLNIGANNSSKVQSFKDGPRQEVWYLLLIVTISLMALVFRQRSEPILALTIRTWKFCSRKPECIQIYFNDLGIRLCQRHHLSGRCCVWLLVSE